MFFNFLIFELKIIISVTSTIISEYLRKDYRLKEQSKLKFIFTSKINIQSASSYNFFTIASSYNLNSILFKLIE